MSVPVTTRKQSRMPQAPYQSRKMPAKTNLSAMPDYFSNISKADCSCKQQQMAQPLVFKNSHHHVLHSSNGFHFGSVRYAKSKWCMCSVRVKVQRMLKISILGQVHQLSGGNERFPWKIQSQSGWWLRAWYRKCYLVSWSCCMTSLTKSFSTAFWKVSEMLW